MFVWFLFFKKIKADTSGPAPGYACLFCFPNRGFPLYNFLCNNLKGRYNGYRHYC
ncbi:hypothetical protein CHK_2671 [Christensenella hongkongensis]|uniref:Uncharacterized protein n=1 Tax=Christensenella hongkongensis TaxID=270498 RepID=A0A0M2NC94_9FIRM|nr:hypothetical protein CHK_2671 [Christensenella hongkongensis]